LPPLLDTRWPGNNSEASPPQKTLFDVTILKMLCAGRRREDFPNSHNIVVVAPAVAAVAAVVAAVVVRE
jgi:hypothetical protein